MTSNLEWMGGSVSFVSSHIDLLLYPLLENGLYILVLKVY
jgi:hypothetical protein